MRIHIHNLFIILFLCLSSSLRAEEVTLTQEQKERIWLEEELKKPRYAIERISSEYFSGKHLIYDCYGRFYACVDEVSFDLCQRRREWGVDNYIENLPCSPIKKYDNTKFCLDELQVLVHAPRTLEFCRHPNQRF